ncbi:acetate--CoA ligase family protein [Clostridia bacterium]|nr:acetate--CoA ligase family protein [Clostridia bacterium]
MNLEKLLKPNRIAVVGASEKEGFGGDTCRNIMEYTKDLSSVFFVNPKRDVIFGQPCYHSLSEIPGDIDMVIICTSKKLVVPLLEEASSKGCGGAVVFASGYSEVGTDEGRKAEEELKALCQDLNIALMGPNCAGFVNYIDNVNAFAFISDKRDRTGSVGFVSQSGQFCLSLMDSPNMKFSYSISAGNSRIVTMEDYIDFLVDDENTKVVSIYMEGVKDPQKFCNSLEKAAKKRKPVIILKAGRSEKGSQLAASHTGSLAGSDKTYDAIFKKFGVIRVDDMEELLATSLMFSAIDVFPPKATFASMNLSGGETGICADLGSLNGLEYPDFSKETVCKLKEQLPSYASVHNPLDMTASLSYDSDRYAKVLSTVMEDENIGIVLIGYTLLLEVVDPAIKYMAEGIEKVIQAGNAKPVIMVPFVENTRNLAYSEKLLSLGVPILPPTVYAFKILRYLKDFIEYKYEDKILKLAIPAENTLATSKALSEVESKNLLSEYGVKVDKAYIATSEKEAVEVAASMDFPIVMKIESSEILHKSDVGGVKLNISSIDEVKKAYSEIMTNVKIHKPNAKINGILMQKMLPQGLEVILGVNNDPQFGPMVLIGLGGVFVEVFEDISLYPAPLNEKEAFQMVESLNSYRMLKGYRGSAPCDIQTLVDTIVQVSEFAQKNKDSVMELDINPLFVYPEGQGVGVADALVVMKK